jgi:hypothetical protein
MVSNSGAAVKVDFIISSWFVKSVEKLFHERKQACSATYTTSTALVTVAASATDALDFLKRAPGTYLESEPLDYFDPYLPPG